MTVLIENVEHHAGGGGRELFPQLREAIGDERLQRMDTKLAESGGQESDSASGGDEPTRDELYERARSKTFGVARP
ncbi:MAG: hypothetical protein M3O86_06405 [Actinomycetota bacterium]|nr:hypothetical protein [Actinomycetota bacterium]